MSSHIPRVPPGSFKELEEKQTSSNISHMAWSPKMDLIAIVNEKGEMTLHRLTWQRVWSHQVGDGEKIGALAFRPDGKALAVGLTSGFCEILNIENAKLMHKFWGDIGIVNLQWIQSETFAFTKDAFPLNSDTYFPKLPNTLFEEHPFSQVHQLKDEENFCVLIAARENCDLCLYGQGVHWIGNLRCLQDVKNFLGKEDIVKGEIRAISMGSNMSLLNVLMDIHFSEDEKIPYLLTYDTSVIQKHEMELCQLGNNFAEIVYLSDCLAATIVQMTESWEDILMEMDTKLRKVADECDKSSGCSLSHDFLRLMMLGQPSASLETFLLMELTDKGVKKLGRNVEDAYSKIRGLILQRIKTHTLSLIEYIIDLLGKSRWEERYAPLGIKEYEVREALNMIIAFLLKSWELLQVVDSSMSTFKSFFQWLLLEIQQLNKEQVSSEMRQKVQEQTKFVAKFICENFSEKNFSSGKFKLEKVGQYFADGELTDPPKWQDVAWVQFLEEHGLQNNETIGLYTEHQTFTFFQLFKDTKGALNKIQHTSAYGITTNCKLVFAQPLLDAASQTNSGDGEDYKVTQMTRQITGQFCLFTAMTYDPLPSDRIAIVAQCGDYVSGNLDTFCGIIHFKESLEDVSEEGEGPIRQLKVIALSFFDNDTLTLLLEEHQSSGASNMTGHGHQALLAQLPLPTLSRPLDVKPYDTPIADMLASVEPINMLAIVDLTKVKVTSHQRAAHLTVSGGRKVAAVLFNSMRRVRLFMMDAEEEFDDEATNDASGLVGALSLDSSGIQDNIAESDNKENASFV